MAFPQEADITKDSIEDFEVKFFVPGPSNIEGVQSGEFSVQIMSSDGSKMIRGYDLLERLTDDAAGLVHLANLADLRDYLRTRSNAEILP